MLVNLLVNSLVVLDPGWPRDAEVQRAGSYLDVYPMERSMDTRARTARNVSPEI